MFRVPLEVVVNWGFHARAHPRMVNPTTNPIALNTNEVIINPFCSFVKLYHKVLTSS
jgi:hypothetical protein